MSTGWMITRPAACCTHTPTGLTTNRHHMLAPALLRSQMLSLLYQAVHRGEMTKEDAERRLFYVQGMRIRLHEDYLLQNAAWQVADQLGWSDTFDAEYIALTQLEAD